MNQLFQGTSRIVQAISPGIYECVNIQGVTYIARFSFVPNDSYSFSLKEIDGTKAIIFDGRVYRKIYIEIILSQ